MENIKNYLQPLGAQLAGHHTARRPELEALIAPAIHAAEEAATDHAHSRRVALEMRKTKALLQRASNPDLTTSATPEVKGPITCHKCQIKCTDADHYLSHDCKPRRRIA
jgi:hypothetical protein